MVTFVWIRFRLTFKVADAARNASRVRRSERSERSRQLFVIGCAPGRLTGFLERNREGRPASNSLIDGPHRTRSYTTTDWTSNSSFATPKASLRVTLSNRTRGGARTK